MTKRKLAPRYSLEAQKFGADCWYYERGVGLELVAYHPAQGQPVRARIPWKMIEATLKRRRAVQAHRRAKAKAKR